MDKTKITVCIMAAAMMQKSYAALAPAITGMTLAFPGHSVLSVQNGVSCIHFVGIFSALLSGRLARVYPKKYLIVAGLALLGAGSLGGFLFHGILGMVYLWSVMIGLGVGAFTPAAASLLVDNFEREERNRFSGIQTSFVNGGGMILTFTGGLLAAAAWHYSYLALLLAFPVLLICLINLPAKKINVPERAEKLKMPVQVYYYVLASFLFMTAYGAFPANISLLISENSLGSASSAGIATAVFMLGGVVCGVFFSKMSMRLGEFMFSLANIALALCFFLLYNVKSLPALLAASFIGGASLSMMLPQGIFSVSARTPPGLSAAALSLVVTVAPGLGNMVSPLATNYLARLLGHNDSRTRLLAAAIMGVMFAAAFFIVTALRRKPDASDRT